MIKVQKKLTDAQRDAIYDLLNHDCSLSYVANKFGFSRSAMYNVWIACAAFESRDPERIEAYRNSSSFVMANWIWAKAKFGTVNEAEEPEEYGTATAIEVLINQQRDILIELARIRTLLEESE